MISRRGFLGAAAAGAFWVGCGRDEARREPPSDADVLRGALRREAAAAGAVAGAVAIARQDGEHLEALAGASGVAAPEPAGGGDAVSLKQLAVFGYVDALPKLSDPELRELVMQIAASEAAHIAALRLAAGEEPVPDAFAGFTVGDA